MVRVTRVDGPQLPEGRYLTCPIDVGTDTGGQTRALLMRNRIFAATTGIRPSVLTFAAADDLVRRREVLLERGLLSEGVDLLNVFEHYRDTDWENNEKSGGRPLPDLRRHLREEATFPDGSPWRRTYQVPHAERRVHDYLRPDGSTYLRIGSFVFKDPETHPTRILRVSRGGEVVGRFTSLSAWFRQWIRELGEGHPRTFVFIDSRFAGPLIAPMRAPEVHLIYLLHNIHVMGERRWDSPSTEVYQRLLARVGDFDAFVTLTDRQRQDIAALTGRTSNLFVVPNPVDMPPEPEVPPERDPRLITVVARLEGQKRLSHAIEAFRHVVAEMPDARMEIWGSGSRAAGLQAAIDRRGLHDSVTMMGHHPRARDALWTSSAMVMTSLFEGYPLSTLESLSHGCPVVSYDIKYGPREQITDGVDGFLVPSGDTRALAERLLRLLRDPGLVGRMSAAALETAQRHGNRRFVSDWAEVVRATVELKARRTRIEHAHLDVHRLEVGGASTRRLERLPLGTLAHRAVGRGSGPGPVRPGDRLRFSATLTVRGRSRASTLADARVEVAAVHEPSGLVIDVPADVRPGDGVLTVDVDAPVSSLFADDRQAVAEGGTPQEAAAPDSVRLRLRLLWANSCWETTLHRPEGARPGLELAYRPDGELRLLRT